MKKRFSVLAVASVFAASSAFASAYRIPEQSIDSVSKSGANIASAQHADATYFNPANMSWLDNAWQVEMDMDYIHLSSIKYTDARFATRNGDTKTENFLAPTLFLVSPDFNNLRFGFSITEPFGLAKRWDGAYPETFANKFDLKIFEFNPTVSYKISKEVSISGGVRALYGRATVNSDGVLAAPAYTGSRFMKGDDWAWGFNVAMSVRPTPQTNLSATYRSSADFTFEGPVQMYSSLPMGTQSVNTDGSVKVITPAVFALSGAYTFFDKLTIELTWDRTFWSHYKNLDFDYDTTLNNPILMGFNTAVDKSWKDSDAFRLGVSYKATNTLTVMGGLAYDETPVPASTLGFELPDSNAFLLSLGARYSLTQKLDLGFGILYDIKSERSVTNSRINGEFKDASALLLSAGVSYKF